MTREEVKKWLPILQAFAEGKDIEVDTLEDEGDPDKWVVEDMDINVCEYEPDRYRIKPAPSCRPFKDCEELVAEYCKRFGVERKAWEMPNIWVRMKNTRFNTCVLIVEMDDKGVARFASTITWQDLMDGYTFLDGSSCGVMEETQA